MSFKMSVTNTKRVKHKEKCLLSKINQMYMLLWTTGKLITLHIFWLCSVQIPASNRTTDQHEALMKWDNKRRSRKHQLHLQKSRNLAENLSSLHLVRYIIYNGIPGKCNLAVTLPIISRDPCAKGPPLHLPFLPLS